MRRSAIAVAAALLVVGATGASAAEPVRIGVAKISEVAPIPIALDKGYFAAQGLDATLTIFQSQAPIAVAVASGDLDAGLASESAALYTLCGDGRVRIIAAGGGEAPGFNNLALVASAKAYAAGLRSPRDLPGHSYAVTQMGTGLQISLWRLAAAYHFDATAVTVLPLQSNPNVVSALSGGRADSASLDVTNVTPLVERGNVKLLGWVGDLTGNTQGYFLFASRDMVDHHPDRVKRLVAAYRMAVHDYYDAFTDANGRRTDAAGAPALLAIIAKFLDQPVARVTVGLGHFDRDARIDVADLQDQLDLYHRIGALKTPLSARALIDERFVVERHDAH